MEERERLPCLTCRQPAELEARLCPQCGASLLVDVTLREHVTDGRVRYRLARALSALPGAPSLGAIQNAFTASPPAAARGVTRAYAYAALPFLSENGVRGTIEKAAKPGREGGFPLGAVAKGIAAVVVVAMAYTAWQQLLHRPTVPEGREAPSGQPAASRRAPSLSTRELAQGALLATVSLRCRDSVGSGFFVSSELVVTNAHVLCPTGESIQVGLSDDRKLVGQVLRAEPGLDLGLVRVAGASARPMPLGDIGDVAVGDRMMIVGSPVGLDFSVQEGSVSSLQRSADGVAYVQLDAKISPGNSGGPVIDPQGRVVGIVSMKISGAGIEGIGLALPINYVYSPEVAFAEPPSAAAAASSAFSRMVARATDGSGGDTRWTAADTPQIPAALDEPTSLDDRPLLVGGHVDQYDRLVVRVLRAAETVPRFEEVTVRLWSGTEAFCTVKGDVETWKEVAPSLAGSGLDARQAAVLRRMAPGQTLFVGESPLRWDLCDRTKMRPGIEIELDSANPLAARLQVR